MFWADGSIYKGFWENGVQSGLGLMIFQDGMKKAGFFKQNIYQSPLLTIKEFEDYEKIENKKIPAQLKQELREYCSLLIPNEDHSMFIG